MMDLHPNGDWFALASESGEVSGGRLDRVVLILGFADELRRMTATAGR
jgi:hypothetical protein